MDRPDGGRGVYRALGHLAYFTYFGISVAAPLVLLPVIGFYLCRHFGWPMPVNVIFIALGLGGSVVSFVKNLKDMLRRAHREQEQEKQEQRAYLDQK